MQKFCKGGQLGVFKKRGGAAASSVRGSTGRQCLNVLVDNFKGGGGGGEIDIRGGWAKYTPVHHRKKQIMSVLQKPLKLIPDLSTLTIWSCDTRFQVYSHDLTIGNLQITICSSGQIVYCR